MQSHKTVYFQRFSPVRVAGYGKAGIDTIDKPILAQRQPWL
jgi:hypothetical protein